MNSTNIKGCAYVSDYAPASKKPSARNFETVAVEFLSNRCGHSEHKFAIGVPKLVVADEKKSI